MTRCEMRDRAARCPAPVSAILALVALLAVLTGCGGATPSHAAAADETKGLGGCGNGVCAAKETCATCPNDCGPCRYCGDGACNGDETCATCTADCGACPTSCGDGTCNGGETCDDCAADCGACPAACGDGACSGDETCTTCAGDCGACPSATGGRIAFVSDRSGTRRIYLARSDGSGVTAVTAGEAPAWSADGRRIAFHRSGSGIYVIDADGTNERFLRAGGFPTWSPDGGSIAFGGTGGIHVMDADGTDPRLLVSNEFAAPTPSWGDYGVIFPAWSPDGRAIAFVRANYEEGWEIYTVNADGSGDPSPVLTGWAKSSPAWSWSSQGSRIAFETVGSRIDPETGVQYSADQVASVAFPTNSDYQVHVADDSPLGSGAYVGDPAWSPDGHSLLFVRGSPRGAPTRIFIVRENGSTARLIPEAQSPAKADYSDREPAWSWTNN